MLSAGDMEVHLHTIGVGGLCTPDAPLVSTVLQSPSVHCNQLLRIADLQSVAIREESFVPDEAASNSHLSVAMFLIAKIGYTPGEIQQPPVEGPPAPMQGQNEDDHLRKRAMMRPPGLGIQVRQRQSKNKTGVAICSPSHPCCCMAIEPAFARLPLEAK